MIELRALNRVAWSPARQQEPITVGIPFPTGVVFAAGEIRVEASNGDAVPGQILSLDQWPDGSIRWALVDFLADANAGQALGYRLCVERGASANAGAGVRVSGNAGDVQVSTGRATFGFTVGAAFPFSSVSVEERQPLDPDRSGFRIEHDGATLDFRVTDVQVLDAGPVRAELNVRAAPRSGGTESPIEAFARIELFAGTGTARVELTVRNRRRARHPSGQWVLGDAGSVFLKSAALVLEVNGPVERVRCAPESGLPLDDVRLPFEIYQDSSGGDQWNGPVHRNRDGRVPMRLRGYRLRSERAEQVANRASPIVVVETRTGQVAVAVPQFWENFPRAISVKGSTIEVGLFPRQWEDLHELQGGEQKTHMVVLAFGGDAVSDPPLAWSHDPLVIHPSPEWSCSTGAIPFLIPAGEDSHQGYRSLVNIALDPSAGFLRKRETADEYGWRNFGDLHADHESAFRPADEPLVSHYNNQYDAVAGFAMHFLRTGDPRWRLLMTDLARHVRDIDIYHTDQDKAAYNGGMFWHTLHYTDAATSTHRTYPRGIPAGGGPSAEHNYNVGLMLHYFMTGERASRDAAIGLARWVLDMDDGRRTAFRWLAHGATGGASSTGSVTYHGPGRAAANSIRACLVAHQLTGHDVYAIKVDELIRRCIHPREDLEALNLLDAERRWYYTVFLQAVGEYLHRKHERREFDAMFGYAQASLVHYARWMSVHERPYLDRPEILEFPTETWAAQDMRKAEVFLGAALHASDPDRQAFLDRARMFFEYSVSTLLNMPTHRFTRPVVLLLSNGYRWDWFQKYGRSLPPRSQAPEWPAAVPASRFEPQKVRAMRRAKWIAAVGLVAVAIGLSMLFTR